MSIRTKQRLWLIIMLVAGMSMVRCGKDSVSSDESISLLPAEKTLVGSSNSFGIKLFKQIVQDEADQNVFISPLSASMALGMTCNGANGATQEAMAATLGLQSLSMPEANTSYRRVIDLLLELDPKVQMELANSIWYRQGFAFEEAFLDVNRAFFDAVVRGMNFSDPATKDVINGWVDEQTHGRITDLIDGIDPATVMFLINAIYFKGTWTYEFDPEDTRDEPFQLPGGTFIDVAMMRQAGDFGYFGNAQFQAVELPYGDGEFLMTILLPHQSVNIDAFIASITQDQWDQWMDSFEEKRIDVYLPKFKLEYERELNHDLTALGMGIAFSGQADFTNMYRPGGLFISLVKQKAFVEVNEEGTEAAAATVVVVQLTAGPGPLTIRMDHPFVFAIRERHSGTILFMGKIVEPVVW